jgi:hypothetical protein
MATVSSFRFDFLSNPVFQPGDVHTVRIGPWDGFIDKSLNFAVWPFDLSTATRSMEVVRVRTETRPVPQTGPSPPHHVVLVDVKNVGPDPIVIWFVFMDVITR